MITELDLCGDRAQNVKGSTKTFFAVDDLTDFISTNIFQTYIIRKRMLIFARLYSAYIRP